MKKTIKLANAVVMAAVIVPVFLTAGAQARTVTYNNGASWSVDRSGGGNVQKTWTNSGGQSTYGMSRSCANDSCQTQRTYNGQTYTRTTSW